MYSVNTVLNGVILRNKKFSSMSNVDSYISKILFDNHYQISEEYDGINGHELVVDYNTRFYINKIGA